MWKNSAARLNFAPREGLAVEAHGNINIYEVSGQLQLYVDTLRPAGEGALYQEFMRLKAKLEAEGLFDESRKHPLPELPHTIGIVTSPTGAALQDMLNTLQRRYPVAEVVLSPTSVQGAEAPANIITALKRLNAEVLPDVILIGRGGGSIEDLWAFNDEGVARAVAASEAPVISGIGHETDFTLTDFAADRRAPTPTAAAEVATPDKSELLAIIIEIAARHTKKMRERITNLRWEYNEEVHALGASSPEHRVNTYQQRLDEFLLRLDRAAHLVVERKASKLMNLQQSLRNLNPQAVLQRGYAIVTRLDTGSIIKNTNQVSPDESIHVTVSQGSMNARITQINHGE
jgi:exodeoxyribonuclease VII large subunit